MLFYITLFIILSLMYLLSAYVRVIKDEVYALACALLYFVMALRKKSVGTDTGVYVWLYLSNGESHHSFQQVVADNQSLPMVYRLYCYTIFQLFPSGQAIIIFNSAIIMIATFLFIKEYSSNKIFSLLLYVFSFSYFSAFNIMRQSVAIALILLSLVCLKRRKILLSVVFLSLSVGFHPTSLFMICVILLALQTCVTKREFKPRFVLVLALAASLAFRILYQTLFSYFISYFSHYSMYEEGNSAFSVNDVNQGRQSLIYIAILLFLFWVLQNKNIYIRLQTNKKLRFMWSIGSICVGFGIFCTGVELLARLLYFMLPILVCVISDLAYECDLFEHTFWYRVILFICFLSLCLYMIFSNYGQVLPYEFFWEGVR